MVNYNSTPLNSTFAALSDPTRRAIIARLAKGSATVKEIAEPFDMSLPAISKHLRILELAGLMVRYKEGRTHHCHLNPEPLRAASTWLADYEQYWQGQFESLAKFLAETDETKGIEDDA
ncbi:MAG: metalloregulator ArsR/SmtB family transcription factor [Chloroflexota bacterium]